MTVLGIDTATTIASVGVVRAGRVLAEAREASKVGHAAGLPELTARAIAEAGAAIADLDGIAVSVGPGSFTGLRVGLSFAKGMAFASGCRLVGVGTLEAFAAGAPEPYRVVAAALDARRGEVYLAVFRRRESGLVERLTADLALTPDDAARRVVELAGAAPMALIGDAAERYPESFEGLATRGIEVLLLDRVHPKGGSVALLGERSLEEGKQDRIDALVPVYVRASAAERNRDAALTMRESVS